VRQYVNRERSPLTRGMVFAGLGASVLLFALCGTALAVRSAQLVAPQKLEAKVFADRMEYDEERELLLAIGSAEFTYGDIYVTADYLEYGLTTDEVVAIGNVIIEDADNRIFANSLELNVDTKVGVVYQADGILGGVFYFSGTHLVKLSEKKFQVFDGFISACSGDRPFWAFRCDRATVEIEKFAVVHQPTFRIENMPAAYLPYFVFPAKRERSTGFLFPRIGASNRDGFTLGNAFFWAIAINQDATFGVDYLSNRGFRPTGEYRYIFGPQISGQMNASYLEDRKRDEEFYQVLFTHRQHFPGDVRSILRLQAESEDSSTKEFEQDINIRSRRATDSVLLVSKNFENRSIQLRARFFDSIQRGRNEQFGRLPEITFNNSTERIRNTPFFFQTDASFINFFNEIDGESTNVSRLDLFPQVSLPMTDYPFLTVVPRVGVRETYYTSQRNSSDGLSRELGTFEARVNGPLFDRVFQVGLGSISKVKHRVEPLVNYNYQDHLSASDEEEAGNIRRFDFVDSLGPSHAIRYGVVNRFLAQVQSQRGGFEVREIARFTVEQRYDIREARRKDAVERRPFSDVRIDLETRVWSNILFNFDSTYDVYTHVFDTVNFELGLDLMERITLQFDTRYGRPGGTFTSFGASYKFLDRWRVAFETRYDGAREEFVQNSFGLDYASQCWGIKWQLIERRDETSFAFLIDLKELGSFGTGTAMRVGPQL